MNLIFRKYCFITAAVLLLVSACIGQEKKPYVVGKKKIDSLQAFSKKHGIALAELRQFNAHLKKDSVLKGDTVFLTAVNNRKAVLPVPVIEYKVTPIGKSGLFQAIVFQGKKYFLAVIDPRIYKVELYHLRNEQPGSMAFKALDKIKGGKLVFAMNAGMFQPDFMPVGLFVSEGKMLSGLNLSNTGHGNFFDMAPNGVFYIDAGETAGIRSSTDFAKEKKAVRIATQSGPMLVINGRYNSFFTPNSPNVQVRNGVGVTDKGQVVFIVSKDKVNFYEFARLFKEKLACSNALYLDGMVSQFYAAEIDAPPSGNYRLATFLTVVKR